MGSHIDQWRNAQVDQYETSPKQNRLISQWLGSQWSTVLGNETFTGELVSVGERDHIGERWTDPAFMIEFDDPSGYPMSIKAHFARFEPVEEMHE